MKIITTLRYFAVAIVCAGSWAAAALAQQTAAEAVAPPVSPDPAVGAENGDPFVNPKPTPTSTSPDICGMWIRSARGATSRVAIRRIADNVVELAFQSEDGKPASTRQIAWSPANQRYEESTEIPNYKGKVLLVMTPVDGGAKLRVTTSIDQKTREELVETGVLRIGAARESRLKEIDEALNRTEVWERAKSSDAAARQELPGVFAASGENSDTEKRSESPPPTNVDQSQRNASDKPAPSENRHVKIFTLANSSALNCSLLLNNLTFDATITADTRTNTVVVMSKDEKQLGIIEAIVMRLDEGDSAQSTSRPATDPSALRNGDAVRAAPPRLSSGGQVTFTSPMPRQNSPQPGWAMLDLPATPEVRKLMEIVAEHDAKAHKLAEEIRDLSQTLGPRHPQQVKARRQLEETLSNALDAKFDLEQRQITALEERLARLKSQVEQRRAVSGQIVQRRARELIEGDLLEWSPPAKASGQSAAQSPVDNKTVDSRPILTPEEIRHQLDPLAKRVTALQDEVRKAEVEYWDDHSHRAELILRLNELKAARHELQLAAQAVQPTLDAIATNAKTAEVSAFSLRNRVEFLTRQLAEGKATEAEVKNATESRTRAAESRVAAKAREAGYASTIDFVARLEIDDSRLSKYFSPIAITGTQPAYPPAVALAWLEVATGLKLEFVTLDDLELEFKSALRVLQSSGDRQAGDLIVSLNGYLFESLDQAVEALRRERHPAAEDTLLAGGLAGARRRSHYDGAHLGEYLKPGKAHTTSIPLEIRLKRDDSDEAYTQYIVGTCVSPEGLVVIPVASKSLAAGESIIAYGRINGKARVVASDDRRGLTLLKIEVRDQQLFPWLNFQTTSAAKGQRLELYDASTNGAPHPVTTPASTTVLEVAQTLPGSADMTDAFCVDILSPMTAPRGARLLAVGGELQGIVVHSEIRPATDAPAAPRWNRLFVIPAVHIDALLKDYRKSAAQQIDLEVPKPNLRLDAEAASKMIWSTCGFKFADPLNAIEVSGQKYRFRGGLPVVDIRQGSEAEKNGIRNGDLLVSLDKWETLSPDNVVWILAQTEAAARSSAVGWRLRFLVIRNGERIPGSLHLASKQ